MVSGEFVLYQLIRSVSLICKDSWEEKLVRSLEKDLVYVPHVFLKAVHPH